MICTTIPCPVRPAASAAPSVRCALSDRVDRQHQRQRDHDAGEHAGGVGDLPRAFDIAADALGRDQELADDGGADRARERDLQAR